MAEGAEAETQQKDEPKRHTYPLIRSSDMNDELKTECMELCVTACEKFSSNNENAARMIKETMKCYLLMEELVDLFTDHEIDRTSAQRYAKLFIENDITYQTVPEISDIEWQELNKDADEQNNEDNATVNADQEKNKKMSSIQIHIKYPCDVPKYSLAILEALKIPGGFNTIKNVFLNITCEHYLQTHADKKSATDYKNYCCSILDKVECPDLKNENRYAKPWVIKFPAW
ncbi:unnamed protein product [Didymodactylos carnosus]|uniref:Uncharacterized protein n=1 Tax=Didymodactylos carnosus TaxID=1234261 RepID=A0A8S2HMG1_9BILA|nr:unnamed protein product [Didymodactylos carnosus]CAF3666806.1 unnamed protein product [Didymodactylos carnosus]